MVGDFLKAHVIRSCADLNRQYESSAIADGERRLRETQLQILLEMYASHLDPSGPSRVPEVLLLILFIFLSSCCLLKIHDGLDRQENAYCIFCGQSGSYASIFGGAHCG